ncbi:MAG: ATPase, partial [Ruminococcaceae bacterium]|nr:ATPase [Oscillospiraceae bacterium]
MSYLGIELGSTRIKAVKINGEYSPVSSGDYVWASEFKNGIWTYDVNEAWTGIKTALKDVDNLLDVKYAG